MIKFINSANNIMAKIETILLIVILLSMILLAFLQVILRNFFHTSILWADTLLRHLVLWIGFIGASLATRERRHINIDAVSRLLSKTAQKITFSIINLFAGTICFFLLRAAMTFIQSEKEAGSILFAGIPTWVFQIIIVIGFGLMMLRFLMQTLENLMALLSPAQKEPA